MAISKCPRRLYSTFWKCNLLPWRYYIDGALGLLLVPYCMFGWWSEVVFESKDGDHTPVVQIGLRYGVIMFITSEVMFFLAWFGVSSNMRDPWRR